MAEPALANRIGPGVRRIAVLRALKLGDLLVAVPALRALRAAFPRAEVTLVGLPWARSLVGRYRDCLDAFVALPGWPGLPEQRVRPERVPAFLAAAQGRRFDAVLQLQGSGEVTNVLAALLGAPITAGFFRPGSWCPDPARFLAWDDEEHEVGRLLRLLSFLGVPPQGEHLSFPVTAADRAERAHLELALDPGGYVCLHPGGVSGPRWPPERFAEVGDALAASGLAIVLTASAVERHVTAAVAEAMRAPSVDLAGRTTLGALASLLADARLLVANDTGAAHLGVAVGVPGVLLFDGARISRWAPLDRRRHRVVLQSASPEDVAAEAADLLEGGRAAVPA